MKNSSLKDMIWTGCNCRPRSGTDMLLHALLLSQKNCLIGRRSVIHRLRNIKMSIGKKLIFSTEAAARAWLNKQAKIGQASA